LLPSALTIDRAKTTPCESGASTREVSVDKTPLALALAVQALSCARSRSRDAQLMLLTNARKRKFHSDFGALKQSCTSSQRFVSAITHSAMIFPSNSVCTWIPKCGCSNLRFSLAVTNGFIEGADDIDFIHSNNDLFVPNLQYCHDASYTFVFLRSPFERLASAFLDKLVSHDERYAKDFSLYRESYADFRLKFSFADFIQDVCRMPKASMNIHWKPQAQFLLYQKYDRYFDVNETALAQKTLKQDIDFDLLDSRPYLEHDSSLFHKADFYRAFDMNLAELEDLKKRGIVPSYQSLYSKDLIDLVAIAYSEDIELYSAHFGRTPLMRRALQV
jgi:hypothetical protein